MEIMDTELEQWKNALKELPERFGVDAVAFHLNADNKRSPQECSDFCYHSVNDLIEWEKKRMWPRYSTRLPTEQAWYFWKPQEDFTGEPVFVFHDDGGYGSDKSAPLHTNAPGRKTPVEMGGFWAGPFHEPDNED